MHDLQYIRSEANMKQRRLILNSGVQYESVLKLDSSVQIN